MENLANPSRLQLESLLRLTHGAAGLIDREGRILYVNGSLLGNSLDEHLGTHVFEKIHPDDLSDAKQRFQQSLDQPGVPIHSELRTILPDGSICVLETLLINKLDDPDIRSILLHCRDVTEQKAALRESLLAQKRSAMIAEITSLLAESLDSSNILHRLAHSAVESFADYCLVHRFNAAGSLYRGAAAHADPAQTPILNELLGLKIEPEAQNYLQSIINNGKAILVHDVDGRMVSSLKEGPYRQAVLKLAPHSWIMAPLVARGNGLGLLALMLCQKSRRYTENDLKFVEELARRASIAIDNERLYRESKEAGQFKDQFLAAISHELRTPLTAIVGWTAFLQRNEVDRKTLEKALASIERSVTLQTSLVDDLLDISRIILGKMRLNLRPVDLRMLVESSVDNMRSAAEAKGIDIEFAKDEPIDPIVCDPDRLQQVLSNLLSNAIKFTANAGHIHVAVRSNPSNQAEIIVSDTGIGISADFLPFVFDRFSQFDVSTTRNAAGLGIGLSIVKHLVDLHGGTVHVESPGLGHGSTFRVLLPQNLARIAKSVQR